MRLWSIHPKYLDAKGLVAVWREGLLAQKILEGKTGGYRNHPQLRRFKSQADPVLAIATYLRGIAAEGKNRGYAFDTNKIKTTGSTRQIPVTHGQLLYEWEHLKDKLVERDPQRYRELLSIVEPESHPQFVVVEGVIEDWEVRK
jgi:hypothetical protein